MIQLPVKKCFNGPACAGCAGYGIQFVGRLSCPCRFQIKNLLLSRDRIKGKPLKLLCEPRLRDPGAQTGSLRMLEERHPEKPGGGRIDGRQAGYGPPEPLPADRECVSCDRLPVFSVSDIEGALLDFDLLDPFRKDL